MFDPALLDLPLHPAWPRLNLRRILVAIAWVICLATAWQRFHHSAEEFDREDRAPSKIWGRGNAGAAQSNPRIKAGSESGPPISLGSELRALP